MSTANRKKSIAVLFALGIFFPGVLSARIEIFLMGQTVGLKPPPLPGQIRFRGTPFGHMALYVESAARDGEKIIRQAGEGEPGGLVLTVDKRLKNSFFTATTREEFFYGGLDPKNLPPFVSRGDIARDLDRFEGKYGTLYNKGPGISGLGQDYGVLYIRDVRGLVYSTTRDEERKIIEFWQNHRHDSFVRMTNNCVTTVLAALNHAGLQNRSFFIRGLAPYNAWTYLIKRFLQVSPSHLLPNGNYARRDGTYLNYYPQIPSDAVCRSGRPFNVYSLQNLEYAIWASPVEEGTLPSDQPFSSADYPSGKERMEVKGVSLGKKMNSVFWWFLSQPEEFCRLWLQSFEGLWYMVAG